MIRHLDLFSGIGGFTLAARMAGGIETVGFCEIDPDAQAVLAKWFPEVPIHDDIRTLNTEKYGKIDLITGGFPCQPWSVAGSQRGAEDDRHLWPQALRVTALLRPAWCVFENVAGLVRLGLDDVQSDLEGIGYTSRAFNVPASSVGADHNRERIWIVAHASGHGCDAGAGRGGDAPANDRPEEGAEKDRDHEGCCGLWPSLGGGGEAAWLRGTEPPPLRVDDGLSRRLDRYRGSRNRLLGNAIHPRVAAQILRCVRHLDGGRSRL